MMEQRITAADIQAMERIRKINFINTLSGYKPACLIGTIGHRGTENVAIFNSLTHVGASPALLAFTIRTLTVPRHTYHNIKAKGYFTINMVHEEIIEQAHQTSANYAAGVSEFEQTGLTPWYSDDCPAPYVKESKIKIGLQYEEEHHIKANGLILMIGRVTEMWLPQKAITETGHVPHPELNSVSVSGLDTYYKAELSKQMGYARVEEKE